MTKRRQPPSTSLVEGGRRKEWRGQLVNVPVERTSTILFENTDELAASKPGLGTYRYGLQGTATHWALAEALTALEHTLADNQKRATLIKKRIAQLRRLRARGASYAEVVSIRDGPLIVQLLTESSKALDTSGANVRRAEAYALYAEGLTMEQIAERFVLLSDLGCGREKQLLIELDFGFFGGRLCGLRRGHWGLLGRRRFAAQECHKLAH